MSSNIIILIISAIWVVINKNIMFPIHIYIHICCWMDDGNDTGWYLPVMFVDVSSPLIVIFPSHQPKREIGLLKTNLAKELGPHPVVHY